MVVHDKTTEKARTKDCFIKQIYWTILLIYLLIGNVLAHQRTGPGG